jgi:DNA-binding beta-propeller fold protein YncE
MLPSARIFTVVGTGQAGYSGDRDIARRAALNQPFDVALDRQGNLYFSDAYNHCVRRVERDSGSITTVAGTGQAGYSGDGGVATQAQLNSPYGIALDTANNLYIVDRLNACIRLVEAATGMIQTIAGIIPCTLQTDQISFGTAAGQRAKTVRAISNQITEPAKRSGFDDR